jgi:hypothetical protein
MGRWFKEDIVGVAVIPRGKSAQVGWQREKGKGKGNKGKGKAEVRRGEA